MTGRTSIADAYIVEHALLRRGLGLLISSKHRKHDGVTTATMYMTGIERGVQMDDRVDG